MRALTSQEVCMSKRLSGSAHIRQPSVWGASMLACDCFAFTFTTCVPAGFEFFEASAKDNINVKQTFERLVDIICEKMSESLDAGDPTITGAKQGPQLTEQPAPPHQDCAC